MGKKRPNKSHEQRDATVGFEKDRMASPVQGRASASVLRSKVLSPYRSRLGMRIRFYQEETMLRERQFQSETRRSPTHRTAFSFAYGVTVPYMMCRPSFLFN
jgi:hypothetical protein